jgi:hypothetical protein
MDMMTLAALLGAFAGSLLQQLLQRRYDTAHRTKATGNPSEERAVVAAELRRTADLLDPPRRPGERAN